ncbi:hypothetical protein [Silvanigrella aquatica]|uniref:Uncharacterized protein n=1 Tax=Silvanigrella aquatica TaxID=1915309 RepID=A0A1L4CXM0_9BACT|nr:hypothetical protein [Silvanigrella aquatica]APJ02702.1 hypothetical protein AXG55_01645 [Silvanigrella aquatica]
MKLNKFLFVSFPIFFYNTNHAFASLGSYLFCASQQNQYDWKWAPPLPNGLRNYPHNIVKPDNKGTWIVGSGKTSMYFHSILDMDYTFENMEAAKTFCDSLAAVCKSAHGENYKWIGTSGYAVAPNSWSYILVHYNVRSGGNSRSVCPNWTYQNFPNKGVLDGTPQILID